MYELWFKQILHELDSIREIFSAEFIEEKLIGLAVHRLTRVNGIQQSGLAGRACPHDSLCRATARRNPEGAGSTANSVGDDDPCEAAARGHSVRND